MKRCKIVLSSFLIVANIFFITYNTYKRDCEVTFINVGQGDCALIQASDGINVMIDCGSESHSNISKNEIIPYLRKENVYKIDVLFVTHWHEDHVNGICDLINNGYVKSLVLPDRLPLDDEKENAFLVYEAASNKNLPVRHVSKDDAITIDGHRFDILNPDTNYTMGANDASMVIKYTYGKTKVLFTGDVESLGQYLLLDSVEDIDIVKVAHHGGENKFSDELSKKLSGKYAVISCGENNKYKHPHDDTLKAFKDYKILRTDKLGPIKLKLNKE
jgi:beta-lactamase superfamily II metal-dependent hydrolase